MALGRRPYAEVWDLQRRLVDDRVAGRIGDTVIVCGHESVFTVGRRRGAMANVLDPGDASVFEVERGGDATWHGPGQVVVYPILLLEGKDRDLHAHLRRLETLMIQVCGAFGLVTGTDERNTGVWCRGRKLGSIGVACRRWVTWHGLALNVDPDLSWFARIQPCGMDAALMTSMAVELGVPMEVREVEAAMIRRVMAW